MKPGVRIFTVRYYKRTSEFIQFKGRIWWVLTEKAIFLFLLNVPYIMPDWFAKHQEAKILFLYKKKILGLC